MFFLWGTVQPYQPYDDKKKGGQNELANKTRNHDFSCSGAVSRIGCCVCLPGGYAVLIDAVMPFTE
jgi:hypothetical protein